MTNSITHLQTPTKPPSDASLHLHPVADAGPPIGVLEVIVTATNPPTPDDGYGALKACDYPPASQEVARSFGVLERL